MRTHFLTFALTNRGARRTVMLTSKKSLSHMGPSPRVCEPPKSLARHCRPVSRLVSIWCVRWLLRLWKARKCSAGTVTGLFRFVKRRQLLPALWLPATRRLSSIMRGHSFPGRVKNQMREMWPLRKKPNGLNKASMAVDGQRMRSGAKETDGDRGHSPKEAARD